MTRRYDTGALLGSETREYINPLPTSGHALVKGDQFAPREGAVQSHDSTTAKWRTLPSLASRCILSCWIWFYIHSYVNRYVDRIHQADVDSLLARRQKSREET